MDWLDKAIRKAGGYRKVAELTGISEHHLRNAGTGRRGIGPAAVLKLQAALPKIPAKRWVEAMQFRPKDRADDEAVAATPGEVAADAS